MRGRFCSLDQTLSKCQSIFVEIMQIRPRNQVKTKKKGLHQKLKSFCPRNQVKTKQKPKKKVFTAIWDYIRPKFVEIIRADRPFFV